MSLRPATQDDVPAMVELQQLGFRAALIPLLPDDFELSDTHDWGVGLAQALAGQSVRGLVVETDDALGGLVTYGTNRDADSAPGAGEIRALFVHPDRWRAGLGRRLVQGACEDLREMGYPAVTLWSLRDNERASAFYESVGFARDGATQVRPQLGAPEVRYARSLVVGQS